MNAIVRRHWLNAGLLGLVGALTALAVFEPGKQAPEIAPLLARRPTQIERIVVEREHQERLIFERRAEAWWMLTPTPGLANAVLINAILQLTALRCEPQYAANPANLKQAQLEPARLRLRLDHDEIRFGTTAPIDGQRYIQVGDTIRLCPDQAFTLLTSAAGSFLASPIATAPPAESGR